MGNCCTKDLTNETQDIQDQFQSLVVGNNIKPAPINIEKIDLDNSDSPVPLFETVPSEGEENVIANPETLSDDELNLYAQKI